MHRFMKGGLYCTGTTPLINLTVLDCTHIDLRNNAAYSPKECLEGLKWILEDEYMEFTCLARIWTNGGIHKRS